MIAHYFDRYDEKAERRIDTSERRELVRYEISKAPRRTGNHRRKINGWSECSEYKLM
jgi:hypothetical protein|tara:strand:- start:13 stop:183 length:171 start_codon:yes stop_codon:yes gene_type:complete